MHKYFPDLTRFMCLAALASCGSAGAQTAPPPGSSARLYGLVDAYLGSMRRSNDPGRTKVLNSGGMNTSFFGIEGREDLGGGLTALYALESFFQADQGSTGRNPTDPFFSKNAWVGLSGSAGVVRLGRQTNPLFLSTGAVNPFGTSLALSPLMLQTWSPNYNRSVLGDSVWDNAIQYNSPTLAGFRFSAVHALGEVQNKDSVSNSNLTANYTRGGLTVVLTVQTAKTGPGFTASTGEQRVVMGGAAYDFGWLTAYGSTQRSKFVDRDLKADTSQLGAAVPVGAGRFLASVAYTSTQVNPRTEISRTTSALGYEYFLSKRTDLYAVMLRDRTSGYASQNSYATGVRHRF